MKKYFYSVVIALAFGIFLGVIYEKYISVAIKEKLEDISFNKKLEAIGYQGEAKIEAIRAYLFHDHNGSITDNILGKKDLALWNTPIGEGDAGGDSNATLVVLEIAGWGVAGKVKVDVVDEDQNEILKQTREFAIFDNDRKFYVPFILPITGCKELTISAKLVGKGLSPSAITQTIPFKCGE
ncbi:hypothetical protein [Polynucleobacter sphagniphilus]|uniref:hypothetical protein n=1 Tax=Polynucleobacter sphagniphilus TaxID=1743169 RepID=UPI002404E890|nr:hypothetical protein [Polynucleobacter sphagniphilus]MDF9788110.1 hypothetical protein [Polynucleobacter sphagniphilus]